MQNYTPISKQEAIAKFGHHFILEMADNRYGFNIVEKLGKDCSIFDEESMDFDEACGALSGKVLINSRRTIIENDLTMNSFFNKIELFLYYKKWMKKEKSDKIYNFLVKDDLARKNLVDPIDYKHLLKPLPEQFYLPATYFEQDKIYYKFKHSNSIHQRSEVIEITPSEIDLSVDENNVISMNVSFNNLSGESVDGLVPWHYFNQYNDPSNTEPYFETSYTGIFIFTDKDVCKQFAIDKLNKDIKHFKQSIEGLS